MDRVVFDKKFGADEILGAAGASSSSTTPHHNFHPSELPFRAHLQGVSGVVSNGQQALRIYSAGNFGSFLGQRQNFHNELCFESKEEGEEWIANRSKVSSLFLTPVECLYLLHDLPILSLTVCGNKNSSPSQAQENQMSAEAFYERVFHELGMVFLHRFVVYRHLQRLGWRVRDGSSFGVDFLLYRQSIEAYHSTMAVRIVTPFETKENTSWLGDKRMVAAVLRSLGCTRKKLLLASVDVPQSLDCTQLKCVDSVRVEISSLNTWRWNRERTTDLDKPIDDFCPRNGDSDDEDEMEED